MATPQLQRLFKSVQLMNPHSIFLRNLCNHHHHPLDIAHTLISIFNNRSFSPDNPQLKSLSPLLNSKLVETTLTGFKGWRKAYNFFNWASSQPGFSHTPETFIAMASILSRARKNALVKDLALEVLNSRCPMSPGALGFFLRCFGNVGLVQEANLLFDNVQRWGLCVPNGYSYNCLLAAIAGTDNVDLMERRLKEMRVRGWGSDKYTLTAVLQVYCNAGKVDEALDVFNDICNRGLVDEHVFSILVLSLSRWGRVDEAFQLIEWMEDRKVRLNAKLICVLIHEFMKQSRVNKALQLFDKIKQSDFAPDVSIYNVLIGGLCLNKELEKALHLYSEMKKLGIQPDDGIVTKLVSSFSEAGELNQLIEEIYKDINVEDLTLLCNSFLRFHVTNGCVDEAYSLLKAMMGNACDDDDAEINKAFRDKEIPLPNATSFSVVINGLLKSDKLDVALRLFQDMGRSSCEREFLLYNNIIDGLCKANRLEESLELLEEMQESGFEPSQLTYNCIFGCICRRGDVSRALNLVKKMRNHGQEPLNSHFTLLVKELCKHGKAVEACKFLADMVQEGYQPHIISYSACMDGLINVLEVDQAMKLFRDICARGYRPDVIAHNTLIKGLCKVQRVAEAQGILSEMVQKGLTPSTVTYNLLIDGWCKNDSVDEAMLCLSKMSGAGLKPNVISYTTLIGGLCKAERPDDAVMLWNEMRQNGCSPDRVSFIAFIDGLCKCGRPNEALVLVCQMEERDLRPDSFIYATLLSAFVTNLDLPKAFEMLKDMVDKGNVTDILDKDFVIVREAILRMSKDARTSTGVKDLIARGRVPGIMLSELETEGEVEHVT